MTRSWLEDVVDADCDDALVRAVVIKAEGSCPREVGAAMLVWAERTTGTIGGGALEHDVIARARELLAAETETAWVRAVQRYQLGPELNQCCGGAVTVLLERFGAAERKPLRQLAVEGAVVSVRRPLEAGAPMMTVAADASTGLAETADGAVHFVEVLVPAKVPLMLYGAGHVARALVRALDDLPFAVTWIDVEADRFPEADRHGATIVVAEDPAAAVAGCAPNAFHLVMTHSHTLDEAIVAAVLRRSEFGYLGLIGSETKRARFRHRLVRAGFEQAAVDRMSCPIGLPGLSGKEPAVIAASVAADMLMRRQGERRIGG